MSLQTSNRAQRHTLLQLLKHNQELLEQMSYGEWDKMPISEQGVSLKLKILQQSDLTIC